MSFNNLDDIRIFNQVVLSNGFSAASAVLMLPTNIVSRRVAALEAQLGLRLLNRSTRKISLTPEGDLLFQRSISLLNEFDQLERVLTKAKSEICGVIRMAVRTTTVEFGLLDGLTDLLKQHPSLEIQLIVSDAPLDIVAEGIDLALMIGDLPSSLLVGKKIGQVIFCLCASKTYLPDATQIRTPQDLLAYNYILSWQKTAGASLALRNNKGEIIQAALTSRLQSTDVRARSAAVYAGCGIGALPIAEVERQVKNGLLQRVLPDYTLPFIPVWCVKPKDKKNDPRLRLIENVLKEVIAKMGTVD